MSYILSTQGNRIEQEPASFAARLLAFAIDAILMGFAALMLDLLYRNGLSVIIDNPFVEVALILLPYFYPIIYEISAGGQTIGKKLLHIRVVTLRAAVRR